MLKSIKRFGTNLCLETIFGDFSIKKITTLKKDFDHILILESNEDITFEYWINQDIFVPPWETHWFQLSDFTSLKINEEYLEKVLKIALNKSGSINMLSKSIGMSSPSLYYLYNKRCELISVKKLKRLLSYIESSYASINKKIEHTRKGLKISIDKVNFPINLGTIYGAQLLGMIISDGCIYLDKKSNNQIRTKYAAGEEESKAIFLEALENIFGKVYVNIEFVRNCFIIRVGSSIIGDSPLKVGGILGRKASSDKGVPWLIKNGTKEMKIDYLPSAFSDEGSLYDGKRSCDSFITMSRYNHLLNLSESQIKELKILEVEMKGRIFPTGHVNKTITTKNALKSIGDVELMTFLKTPSKLLFEEAQILNSLGIETKIYSRLLSKTSAGRYSVCHDLHIRKNNSIIKFYKGIGFSLSRKQEKLCLIASRINGFEVI